MFLEIIPTWFYLPIIAFLVTFIVGKFIYKPIRNKGIMKFFVIKNNLIIKYSVIVCSCYVAYAIGTNNVGNVSGPMLSLMKNNMSEKETDILLIIVVTLLIVPWFGISI